MYDGIKQFELWKRSSIKSTHLDSLVCFLYFLGVLVLFQSDPSQFSVVSRYLCLLLQLRKLEGGSRIVGVWFGLHGQWWILDRKLRLSFCSVLEPNQCEHQLYEERWDNQFTCKRWISKINTFNIERRSNTSLSSFCTYIINLEQLGIVGPPA